MPSARSVKWMRMSEHTERYIVRDDGYDVHDKEHRYLIVDTETDAVVGQLHSLRHADRTANEWSDAVERMA